MSIPTKGRVEIDFKFTGFGTEVTIDGVKVPGVVDVRISHRVGEAPRLYLEILPELGAKIIGEAEVVTVHSHDSAFAESYFIPKRPNWIKRTWRKLWTSKIPNFTRP